jgi:rhodanese-related sulfurtransferase
MNFLKTFFGGDKTLDAAEAKARIDNRDALVIVDVRSADEYRSGHIPGAKLMPLNEIRGRLNELPKDKQILCVCRSGARSGSAVGHLTGAGFDAVNLSGGMMSWQRAGFPVSKAK